MLVVTLVALVAVVGAAYGWVEAGWLRTRVLEVGIRGLPPSLDGVRVAHLSDFHLGAPVSRGNRASEKAVEWVSGRRPDLVCVTGDLLSHPRGEPRLRRLMAKLDRPLVVLGNHDVAVTRDPFSRATELRDLERARLLRGDWVELELRGEPVVVVGIDPTSYRDKRPPPTVTGDSVWALRLLLCHFPGIVDRVPRDSYDLVLSGHLHSGQICLPAPGGRVTLAHPRARFVSGLYETDAGVMHISPGTGTTFVPFRLLARPEVTELVLRRRH
jgi:uncharacterized protein